MKKTLMINLTGTVFHIDEDAYDMLDKYVTSLRNCFAGEKDGKEITGDMEVRISELFLHILEEEKSEVITIENVETVIKTMGKPEELKDNDENNNIDDNKEKYCNSQTKKKLYRNLNDKILGGVCSGIASYLDWDVTLVRILFILLGVFIKGFIIVYVIAWIVIPGAKTAEEKLYMTGKTVTLENIGKSVTENYDNSYKEKKENKRSTIREIGEVFVSIIGVMIKAIFIILAICFIPILFVFLLVSLLLIVFAMGFVPSALTGDLYTFIPLYNWDIITVSSPLLIISTAVCGIFVVGIPIVALIHTLMRRYGSWMPMTNTMKITFVVIWVISLILAIIFNATYMIF